MRTELRQVPWTERLPTYTDLADLPVLDAVINGALRLYPAAPAILQRDVPLGGRTTNGILVPVKVREFPEKIA